MMLQRIMYLQYILCKVGNPYMKSLFSVHGDGIIAVIVICVSS